MMLDLEMMGLKDPHLEVKEKVDFWHSRLSSKLSGFNDMANFWRLIRPTRSGTLDGFANPQVTETTRATETIASFMYRGMTSQQPNFALTTSNRNISQEDLWVNEQIIIAQQTATNRRRKLLKTCRSLALFGTELHELPWVVNLPYWEATDFVPRSLLQMAFDPLVFDISQSPWYAIVDFFTEGQIRAEAKKMPDIWDQEAMEKAISNSANTKGLSSELTARLANAGYSSYSSNSNNTSRLFQVTTYYGPLRDDAENRQWTVRTINDMETVCCHEMPYKRKPISSTSLNEFEVEPYGYGVGSFALGLQPEINSNRARMHDTITFSLFNMWLASRMANIKSSQLKVKPWGVVQVDGDPETSLKAIRPQLEGVNYGIQIENLMKTEFRSTTGASDNLQAIVTQATATESSIAQNEAVRRLSVMTEIASESLVREDISRMLENNQTFLDQPFSVAVSGQPYRVFPSDLMSTDIDVVAKITTDKDFRPQRNKDLLQFLQVVTSIRNQNPQMGQVNLEPFVEEFARGVGMNPKSVWSAVPQLPGITQGAPNAAQPTANTAMDKIQQMMHSAEGVRSNAGEIGAESFEGAQG